MDLSTLKLSGLLFDLDGVILNSEGLHDEALLAAARHFGFDPAQVPVMQYKGWTEPAVAADVLKRNPGTEVTVGEFIAFKDQTYVALAKERLTLVEGAADFLSLCGKKGLRLGLVTSALRSNAEGPLRRFGLEGHFEFLITGEDVRNGKPHPEPYEKGVSGLGMRASQVAAIEDALNGIRSGKAAGCVGIGLTTSFSKAQLKAAGADLAVESYAELKEAVFGRA